MNAGFHVVASSVLNVMSYVPAVSAGDSVEAGDPLIDGPLVPHDILRVLGIEKLAEADARVAQFRERVAQFEAQAHALQDRIAQYLAREA